MIGLLVAMALTAAEPQAVAPSENPVALDLVVRDARNRPVERLPAGDVTVSTQGQPLAVAGLERVQSAKRTLAIFLDEFHVTAGPEAERARTALVEMIGSELRPEDELVVIKPLDSLLDIQFHAGDRSAALAAVRAFTPRQDDYEPRTDFERRFIAGAPPQIAAARAQISASALTALITALGAAESGRKTLFVVSDGFSRRGGLRGEVASTSFENLTRAANRARVSVYPLNLVPPDAGADAADRERAHASLVAFAGGTAGRILDSTPAELAEALHDASDYFLVTLASDAAVGDSRMHDVAVNLRTRGVTWRARPAFFSQSAADRARVAALLTPPEPRPAPVPRRTSTLIRPWFGMSRQANGETLIDFAWEASAPAAGLRNVAPPPASLTMSVTSPDGHTLFEGSVAPSGSLAATAGGAPTRASFSSPPGRVLVQMAIEDASSRVLDRDVRDLMITRFQGPLVIGTPEVSRARTARERERWNTDGAPIAVSRQFSRTEWLRVQIPVSGITESAKLSARLVSEPGSVLRLFEPTAVESRPGYFEVELPLAWLAMGNYTLEFSAESGGAKAAERLAFRVTP